jgi:hypothetical protein
MVTFLLVPLLTTQQEWSEPAAIWQTRGYTATIEAALGEHHENLDLLLG